MIDGVSVVFTIFCILWVYSGLSLLHTILEKWVYKVPEVFTGKVLDNPLELLIYFPWVLIYKSCLLIDSMIKRFFL